MIQQFQSWDFYLEEKNENKIWKDTPTPVFLAALSYSSQDEEATQVSINKWMDKEDVAYIYNGIYSEKDKYCMLLLLLLSHFSHVQLCATP